MWGLKCSVVVQEGDPVPEAPSGRMCFGGPPKSPDTDTKVKQEIHADTEEGKDEDTMDRKILGKRERKDEPKALPHR